MFGAGSMTHWLILLVIVLIVFGGSGKISSIMGDVAKGIKSFKKGMADDDDAKPAQHRTIENEASARDTTKTG